MCRLQPGSQCLLMARNRSQEPQLIRPLIGTKRTSGVVSGLAVAVRWRWTSSRGARFGGRLSVLSVLRGTGSLASLSKARAASTLARRLGQPVAPMTVRHLARNDREKGGRAGIKPRAPPLVANHNLSRPKPRGKMAEAERLRLDRETPKPGPARVSPESCQQRVDITFRSLTRDPWSTCNRSASLERDARAWCALLAPSASHPKIGGHA